jgi:hypothetical protein
VTKFLEKGRNGGHREIQDWQSVKSIIRTGGSQHQENAGVTEIATR